MWRSSWAFSASRHSCRSIPAPNNRRTRRMEGSSLFHEHRLAQLVPGAVPVGDGPTVLRRPTIGAAPTLGARTAKEYATNEGPA